MPHQDTSPKALRAQLRAHCAHETLRFALCCAYPFLWVTSFIYLAQDLNSMAPIALVGALITLTLTTLLMFAYMLADILDALLRLYASPHAPHTSVAAKPKVALSQLREATAYGSLRVLLWSCYLVAMLASIPLSALAFFTVAAGGLIVSMFARAVVDIADALLRAQSHLAQPPADA